MKIYVVRVISLFLLIFTMAIIFSLSADTGEESGNLSGEVTEKILGVFGIHEENYSADSYNQIKNNVDRVIRKCAHFLEYAWLGVISYIFFGTYDKKPLKTAMLALCICVPYAALDEWHQSFVPGRGPGIKDVVIDSLGALFGVFFMIVCGWFLCRRANRKKYTQIRK
jgi:VanZ family protein